MKLAIVGVVFLSALGVLVWMGVVEGMIPRMKIQDLKSSQYKGGYCRIDEGVEVNSIEHGASPLEFTIRSTKEPDQVIAVTTKRNPPDNFKVGIGVAVTGTFDPKTGKFVAEEVTTACPSKYQASKSPAMAGADAPPPEKTP